MEVKINAEVAEQVIAKFTPAAAQAYCENLAILKNACKKFANDSNSEAAKQTLEAAEKLCRNAEATYPDVFKDISDTISTVLEAYKTADTM